MQRKKSKRAVSRPGRPARRSPAQRTHAELVPMPAGAPTPLSSLRVTFLGQLHEARERIDTAISAIEALG